MRQVLLAVLHGRVYEKVDHTPSKRVDHTLDNGHSVMLKLLSVITS
jgi:hypothetical protein